MPNIIPTFLCFVAYRKHERAKVLARSTRLGVPDDHHLLLMHGLELESLARSLARVVESRCPLGDHSLFLGALCFGKFASTKFSGVLAVAY